MARRSFKRKRFGSRVRKAAGRRRIGRRRAIMSRRRSSRHGRVIRVAPGIFPLKMKRTLRFVARFSHDVTVGGAALLRNFSANNIRQPNIDATGSGDDLTTRQPQGFDQLMAWYREFVVIGSRITVTANTTDTGSATCFGVIAREQSGQISTNPLILLEQQNIRWVNLNNRDAAGSMKTVSHKFSTRKFFGVPKVSADATLHGSATSNPSEEAFFQIYSCPFVTGADTTRVDYQVTIDYIAVFKEPANITTLDTAMETA